MTCTCCGDEMSLPGGCVATAPGTSAVLCDACGAKWRESVEERLHRQLVKLRQWGVALSQFRNWVAVHLGSQA